MIGDILQPTHLLFILVVALLVLGPKRLPEVGRSLGKGLRDFRGALSGDDRDEPEIPAQSQHTPQAEPQTLAPQAAAPAPQATAAAPEATVPQATAPTATVEHAAPEGDNAADAAHSAAEAVHPTSVEHAPAETAQPTEQHVG